ncbi:MAG: PIN domain-containing protein [Chloroflexota bacterium]|jgi:predicted nucleic acid-binding protein
MVAVRKLHVDSNVVLRYLVNDPPGMAEKASLVFSAVADGKISLIVEEIVIAEVTWVLQSFYRHSPKDISNSLMQLLLQEGIESPRKEFLLRALLIYGETGVKFGDALLAAHVTDSGQAEIISFDEHFDRIPRVRRILPGEPV